MNRGFFASSAETVESELSVFDGAGLDFEKGDVRAEVRRNRNLGSVVIVPLAVALQNRSRRPRSAVG